MHTLTMPACQTCWHVTEAQGGRTYHVTNSAPHMLRWILEPYGATHWVAAAHRRRATSGPSFLRVALEPIAGGPLLIVHVVLMRSLLPARPTVPPPSPALITGLAADRTRYAALGIAV